jgi:XTP/dITP diphosphohydrolase
MKIVMATTNRGKVKELEAILTHDPAFEGVEILTLTEAGLPDFDYEETADTFEGNAVGKAVAAAQAANLPAIADDSGLCVDALDGEPGVYSARWAGESATDVDRNRLLLDRLAGVPEERRTARFVCVMAFAMPDGKIVSAEGTCDGIITSESKGNGGFGYDPVFYVPNFGRTFAELAPVEKNMVSHRRAAINNLAPRLYDILASKLESVV